MLVSHAKCLVAAAATIGLVTGCAGGSSTPTTPNELQQRAPIVGKHATSCPCLYVTNFDPPYGQPYSVTVYAAGAQLNARPTQTVAGSNTGLSQPYDIAVDASGDMYVTNPTAGTSGAGSVTVYAAGANGNVAPIQTISGSLTGLSYPTGVALDPAGNIYVANLGANSVTIYAPGANGNVAPIGTIAGSNTGL